MHSKAPVPTNARNHEAVPSDIDNGAAAVASVAISNQQQHATTGHNGDATVELQLNTNMKPQTRVCVKCGELPVEMFLRDRKRCDRCLAAERRYQQKQRAIRKYKKLVVELNLVHELDRCFLED